VQQLIAKEKADPGKLNYASSGNGASSHLAGVLFNDMAGTKLVHVPFKGTGPALNALLAGQVDMTFTDILTAMPYIKSGKFKALGMTTAQRSRPCPTFPPWPSRASKASTSACSSAWSPRARRPSASRC
jgi:tripartite-type tricarboxylate transporter receptor subunit TctC